MRAFRLTAGASLASALALALALAGAPAAQPLPAPPVEHGAFATAPRFVAVAATGDMQSQDGTKMCVAGNPFVPLDHALREGARPIAQPDPHEPGCTLRVERPGPGLVTMEHTCRRADGAATESYRKVSGTAERLTSHVEMTLPSPPATAPAAAGRGRVMRFDMTTTDLGPCPAGLHPGDVVGRDGTVRHTGADRAARAQAQAR